MFNYEKKNLNKKLKIFHPNNSFRIHKTTLILLTLVSVILLIHLSKKVFPENIENLDLLNFVITVITFLYFVFFLIYTNIFRYESENGNFSGYLVIENDKIICDKTIYPINEIDQISILTSHIRGNYNNKTAAFEPKKDNGLKNYIEIHHKNEVTKYYFLQTKKENIKMFTDELKSFYNKGLIGKQNFENIIN